MTGNVKKLSNKAPIILTWVPRVRGASLPDGKNSDLSYLYQFLLLMNQIRSIAELFNCGRGKRGNKFTQ
ncbi:MAG: hypothetical protein ACEY3K_15790, partial [Wolbachia sp.]